jgi:alkanesulfonate monooxygenase SsuD/methylene tetrahydromethanopterin reductase-like flavin-dependent oxidoreductase (luciferase family)
VSVGSTPGATANRGTAQALANWSSRAEELGADALWAVDHLFWHEPMLECFTSLTVAATATQHIPIGSCVLQLPLRSAPAIAKVTTALQLLSGDRMVLGLGVGSHPGEYEAAGVDYAHRGRLLDEGIRTLRACWENASGAYYHQAPQGSPVPVWIGGVSEAAVHRAATLGDGYVPLFLSEADFRVQMEKLDKALAHIDRSPDEVTRAVVVMMRVGTGPNTHEDGKAWLSKLYGLPPKAFDRHLVSGPPAQCAERLANYAASGAEHVVVMMTSDRAIDDFAELIDAVRRGRAHAEHQPVEVSP